MAFPKKPAVALMIHAPGSAPDEPDGDEGEFQAPEGMDLEGKNPGDTIEVVATCEIKPDGKLCVRKVNGMDVPGYDDKDKTDDESAPDDDSFTSAAMGDQSQGGDTEEGA